MDDIETRLKKAKRRRSDEIIEEIKPIKSRKIGSLSAEPEMNIDEGEREIFESGPTLREMLFSPEDRSRVSFYIDNIFTGKLTKLYMHTFFNDKNKEIDNNYGLYLRNDDTLILGNSPIQFENDIIVNKTEYIGRPGLYELIFMKERNDYVYTEDLKTYALILESTNAHKQGNKMKGNRGRKYINIIKKLFPIASKGSH